jgi:hypothetical protein
MSEAQEGNFCHNSAYQGFVCITLLTKTGRDSSSTLVSQKNTPAMEDKGEGVTNA